MGAVLEGTVVSGAAGVVAGGGAEVAVAVEVAAAVAVVGVEAVSGHSPSPGWQSVGSTQALPFLLRGTSTL